MFAIKNPVSSKVLSIAVISMIFASALSPLGAPVAEAADTDFKNPTSNSQNGSGDSWNNASNAYSNGSGSASNPANDDRHRFAGFGISIPSGSTINGIEVVLDSWTDDNGGDCRIDVDLSWDNGSNWTSEKSADIGTSEATQTLGNSSDDWRSGSWTPAEFSNFVVRVQAEDPNNDCDSNDDIFLDWLRVKVYYTGGDTTAPTVTNVTSSTDNGNYNAADAISIQIVFSENVLVVGTPQLTLETGSTDRTINYASGSGTNTLTFNYTVQAGDTSADLNYALTSSLALNGGTIKDAATNSATLTLPALASAQSLAGSKALVIDTTAPTLSVVTPVVTPTNDSTPNYTFSSSEAGPVTFGGACTSAPLNAVAGSNVVTFDTLADNTYTNCTVRVTDAAGNQSTTLAVNTFTVDTAGPTVTLGSTVSAFTNVSPIPFTALFTEMVSGFLSADVSVTNGSVVGFSGSGTSYSFGVLPGAEGPISVNIPGSGANDAAGNPNSASVVVNTTYDITAPTLQIASGPAAGSIINTPNVTFTFTTDGTDVACSLDGGTSGPCTTNDSHTLSTLTDGPHTFTVFATDEALNQYSLSVSFTFDTAPPVVTITLDDATPEATDSNGAVATYTFTAIDTLSGNVASSLSCDHASGETFPLGPTLITCTALDVAGNIGTGMTTVTVVDTTPPTISVDPEDQNSNTTNPDGVVMGYSVTATDSVDANLNIVCTPLASGSLFPIGTTVITCTATDDAGNSATDTATVSVETSGYAGGSTDVSSFDTTVPEVPATEENTDTGNTDSTDEVAPTEEIGEAQVAQVLGESTVAEDASAACVPIITSYIGRGTNNPDEVKALQSFLNMEMNATLDVTGIFDSITKEAVKAFQLKYWMEILQPWVPFGLSVTEPTGIVYKTTQRMINMLSCPGSVIPMPELP